ncbi:hypothetical protein PVK06_015985 [Gossypium arboreum]|uniref:Selenoprotein K n=1 Tax=Gossypium arboreum TaxID=29729 RepID=A0ABR0PYR6_GOSAR|nr:hypothetical protein PVK06_015985 [Gossypium arboreum]
MAYVEGGVVKSKRSIWRLRTITDFFWAIINFIGVFFSTMFSMEKSDAYRKGFGSSKKWDGGPGGPGSGPYGGGGGPRRPPRGMDNVRGIDHSTSFAPFLSVVCHSFPFNLSVKRFFFLVLYFRFPSCLWLLLRWLIAASIHIVHVQCYIAKVL